MVQVGENRDGLADEWRRQPRHGNRLALYVQPVGFDPCVSEASGGGREGRRPAPTAEICADSWTALLVRRGLPRTLRGGSYHGAPPTNESNWRSCFWRAGSVSDRSCRNSGRSRSRLAPLAPVLLLDEENDAAKRKSGRARRSSSGAGVCLPRSPRWKDKTPCDTAL